MLALRGIGYRFPVATKPAVSGVDLDVTRGELVLLTGASGSGKSTVLRLAAGLLGRHGRGTLSGSVTVDGIDPTGMAPSIRVRHVGFVSQDPDDQRVAATVGAEVAFAAESAGLAAAEVAARVETLLDSLGLPGGPDRDVSALSSGQRQRLSIAAALSAGAGLLLLDEPLAHLDPQGARELVARLRGLANAGHAVLVVEHRVEALQGVVDRVITLDRGRVVAERLQSAPSAAARQPRSTEGETRLVLDPFTWHHPGGDGLEAVSLRLHTGDRLAVVGDNGAGKSTLLRALAGELGAHLHGGGRVVGVPANPDLALFSATVAEELAYAPGELGLPCDTASVAASFGVAELLDRPPQALSRGQRLRVAVASAVTARPAVLLLDEPTAGQDADHVAATMSAIEAALPDGALVFATHDLALARTFATRILVLDAGRVTADGAPEAVLDAIATNSDFARRPRSPTMPAFAPRPGGLDPRTRLALVGLVGMLAVALDHAPGLALLTLICAAAFALRAPSRRTLLAAAGVLAAVTWSTVLSQGLFYGDEPRVALLAAGPLTLWREGVAHGLVQSLRFAAMSLAGFTLAASTPPERLFAALLAVRVPFGLGFLVVTAFRFVPDVAREWQAVRAARRRRGRPAWQRPPWRWLGLEASLLLPVLARALRRARALAESLDARGFDPVAPRAVAAPLVLRAADVGVLCAGLPLACVVAASRLLFVLYTTDTWYHPALIGLYSVVRGW